MFKTKFYWIKYEIFKLIRALDALQSDKGSKPTTGDKILVNTVLSS